MRIQQSAFEVGSNAGKFIGIVAFDADKRSALSAAIEAWGESSVYRELSWEELLKATRAGMPLFTCSVQSE